MKLKSYFSETVESAMAQARQELGAEAMLLNSRKSPAEARHLGAYEVIFVTETENGFEQHFAETAAKTEPPAVDRLSREMAELRKQVERATSLIQRADRFSDDGQEYSVERELYTKLIGHEIETELAEDIVRASRKRTQVLFNAGLEQIAAIEIAERFAVDTGLDAEDTERKAIAVIGPPGVGKTAMVVKLAVRFGIAERRRVHLITLDTDRVGGADQLRTYAAVIGASFDTVESKALLEQTIARAGERDLVLIDTPGYENARPAELQTLASLLNAVPAVTKHLLLSGAAKSADLKRTLERYRSFQFDRVAFGRLDETESYGSLLNTSVVAGVPVSFLSTGPTIPDDLATADALGLTQLVLEGRKEMAAAAAA